MIVINRLKESILRNRCLVIISLLGILPLSVAAREKGHDVMMKKFLQVCNAYKTCPLHVTVNVTGSADIVTSLADTFHYQSEFYILPNGAYIKINEEEQLVNDSLIVFVDHEHKKMLLYSNRAGNVAAQMSGNVSMWLADSSLNSIAKRYVAEGNSITAVRAGTAGIKVTSKEFLPGTSIPKEIIKLVYETSSARPVELVQMYHKMIPLDSATYASFNEQLLYPGKLVSTGDGIYYLIKEVSVSYSFEQWDDKNINLPVSVDQYIEEKADGKFTPRRGYVSYTLWDERNL